MDQAKPTKPKISVRTALADDETFLHDLYRANREAELTPLGWNEEMIKAFGEMQFQARERSYRTSFPNARTAIIEVDAEKVGAIIVDRGPDCIHVVDISVSPTFHRRGIGRHVLDQLKVEAEGQGSPITLRVDLCNQVAQSLYTSLGFEITSSSQIHHLMEWTPGGY